MYRYQGRGRAASKVRVIVPLTGGTPGDEELAFGVAVEAIRRVVPSLYQALPS